VDGNRWERQFVADKLDPGKDLGVLEYIPERDQAFYMAGGKAYFYDFKNAKWIYTGARLKTKIKYDYVGCYDPKRGKVYILDDANLFAYDITENAWSVLQEAPLSFGYSTRGQINFDAASGMVIGVAFGGDKRNGLPAGAYVFNPDDNSWSHPISQMPGGRGTRSSFYHRELNAHFVHVAGDSRDDGVMLVYRYRAAGSTGKKK
jgi:hypothetical protein